MNIIIPISSRIIANSNTETVHARKLHEFLGVGRDYSNWIKARIKQYGFIENEDYILIRQNGRTRTGGTVALHHPRHGQRTRNGRTQRKRP